MRITRRAFGLQLWLVKRIGSAERLKSIARSSGVAARVHFTGDMKPSRVGLFLAGLDVFVFPTLAESFGLAAVEAAQAGIPVVANDLPVLREVLAVDGEPCALFAVAADTPDFAAKIDRLFDEPDLAARNIALGRKLGAHYSVPAMVDAYAGLIRSSLGAEPSPSQSAPSRRTSHTPAA